MKVIAYFVLRDAAETTLAKGRAGVSCWRLAGVSFAVWFRN